MQAAASNILGYPYIEEMHSFLQHFGIHSF